MTALGAYQKAAALEAALAGRPSIGEDAHCGWGRQAGSTCTAVVAGFAVHLRPQLPPHICGANATAGGACFDTASEVLRSAASRFENLEAIAVAGGAASPFLSGPSLRWLLLWVLAALVDLSLASLLWGCRRLCQWPWRRLAGRASAGTAAGSAGACEAEEAVEVIVSREEDSQREAVAYYEEGLLSLAQEALAAREEMEALEADTIAEAAQCQAWKHVLRDEIAIMRAQLKSLHSQLESGTATAEEGAGIKQIAEEVSLPQAVDRQEPRRAEVGGGAQAPELAALALRMAELQEAHARELEAFRLDAARASLQAALLTSEVEAMRRGRAEEFRSTQLELADTRDYCEAPEDEAAARAGPAGAHAVVDEMRELEERVGGLQATLEEEAARCFHAKAEARQELLDEWRRDPSAGWSSLRGQPGPRAAEPRGVVGRGKVQEHWEALREHERTLREQQLLSVQQHRRLHLAEAGVQQRTLLSEQQELLSTQLRCSTASSSRSRSPSPAQLPKRDSLGKVWEGLNSLEARSSIGGCADKNSRVGTTRPVGSRQPRPSRRTEELPPSLAEGEPEGEPEHTGAEVGARAEARTNADEEEAVARGLKQAPDNHPSAAPSAPSARPTPLQAYAPRLRPESRSDAAEVPDLRLQSYCLPWVASLCQQSLRRNSR